MAERHPRGGSPKPVPRQRVREDRKSYSIPAEVQATPDPSPVVQPDCPVCLQPSIHPVKIPCGHVFCFLCVKGASNQSQRCALCRQAIPSSFFDSPTLLHESASQVSEGTERYAWFYEGRNGWWQYDERTNTEIEEGYRSKKRSFELLIAGYMYIIDLDSMLQIRRSDLSRRRRIKQDLVTAPKKGIAGLKMPQDRDEGEEAGGGGENQDHKQPSRASTVVTSQAEDGLVYENASVSPDRSTDQLDDRSSDRTADRLSEGLESLSLRHDPEEEDGDVAEEPSAFSVI